MLRSNFAVFCILGFFLVFGLGCSDDSEENGTNNPQGDTDTMETDDENSLPDPLTVVPPEKLDKDAATECPGAYATLAPAAGLNSGYTVAEQEREFFLTLPDGFEGPRPMLIAFNGTGGDGKDFTETAELQDFADAGFIVVAPSSNENGTIWPVWDGMRLDSEQSLPNPDLDLFDSLVGCIAGHFEVDAKRIYITGHSAGGIMTNYVLKRRSELLAGGIPASGMHDNTLAENQGPLDSMVVIVTWGGLEDQWSGDAEDSTVNEIDFVSQSALSTKYYYDEAKVTMIGASQEKGHKFLFELNSWFIETLLSIPKGYDVPESYTPPAFPEDVIAQMYTEPYEAPVTINVTCEEGTVTGCMDLCQFMGDCVVSNNTLRGPMEAQLADYGFTSDNWEECSACVSTCDTAGAPTEEADILTCLSTAGENSDQCTQGISGGGPFIDGVNTCCKDKTESTVCKMLCESILENTLALGFFPTCNAFTTETR